MDSRYYTEYAAAAIRGFLLRHPEIELPDQSLVLRDFHSLTDADCEAILDLAHERGIKIHHFKRSSRMLPRVSRVLGFLRGISPESILDVGSGRGVFLLPLLESFPWVDVYSADILDKRVEMLSDISRGGVDRLHVMRADVCDRPLPERSVDVVTMLEVLEHIPRVEDAVRAATQMARKFVVVSVPSKEDDNPEHIHLLTRERLTAMFASCGVHRLSFDAVPGHLLTVANLGG